jgi:uncharacterized protein (TIGR02996 family)
MARSRRATPVPAPEPATQLAGLVQNCKDEPDDDGLRLILADWLDDHGEPERAELIRLSLATSHAKVEPACQAAIHARMARLYHDHGERWLGPLRDMPGEGEATFDRGLISVTCRMEELRRPRAPVDLASLAPWTERLRLLFGKQTIPGDYIRSDCASAFTSLDLSNYELAREYLAEVATSKTAPHLRELRVEGRETSPRAFAALFVASSKLAGLRALGLKGHLSLPEVRELVAAPFAPGLRSLTLVRTDLSNESLRALAAARSLAGVRRLEIIAGLPDNPDPCLMTASHLRQLHTLRLVDTFLDDAWTVPLAGSPVLATVRVLDLENNNVTDATAQALAASPHVGRLEELILRYHTLTDAGVQALVSSPGMANLRRLDLGDLGYAGLGPATARAIAESPYLGKLESLTLESNSRIGKEGLLALFQSERLPALRDLDLSGIDVTRRCLQALVAGPLAPQLRRLRLSRATGADILARARSLCNLEALEFSWHSPARDVIALAESASLEKLLWLSIDLEAESEAAMAALAGHNGLPSLMFLRLKQSLGNRSSAGLEALRTSPRRDGLFVLDLPRALGVPRARVEMGRGMPRVRHLW